MVIMDPQARTFVFENIVRVELRILFLRFDQLAMNLVIASSLK